MANDFSEPPARIEQPTYFSSLLAALFVWFMPIAVVVFGFNLIAVDVELNRPNIIWGILLSLLGYPVPFVTTILILPMVRRLQPMRSAYWLLAMYCFSADLVWQEIMVAMLPGHHARNFSSVAILTGGPLVLSGLFGLLFVPIQRLFDQFFELFRWRRWVR